MVAYLKKLTENEGFQEIVDFLNGTHIRIVDNREQEITATIDGKEFTVTEATVSRHLQLADAKEEGEGSGHPSEPQPPPSTAQPTHGNLIPIIASSLHQKIQTPRRMAVSTGSGRVSTASRMISTAEESVSTAGASMPVSTAGMIDKETAVRLQEQFDEEKRQRMARVHEATQTFTEEEWENIRARVEADEELTQRLQAEEKNKYSEAEAKRKKLMTQAQQRTYMSNYIKHMGKYTLKQLKNLSFDEIKELFKATMRSIKDFVPIESKDDKAVPKLAEARSSKRDAMEKLNQRRSKKQKIGKSSEPRNKDVDELSQEELQQLMIIVPEQGMNVEALQTKYLIIDWEIYTEDTRKF
nr:hypothetical protein [Tanacetum cinerariifolium]